MFYIDILTIFPEMIDAYTQLSILGRAQKKKLLKIQAYNIRDYVLGKRKNVDDRPFGGGPGMVMQVLPFFNALQSIKVIPRFSQKDLKKGLNKKKLVLDYTKIKNGRKKLKTRVILTSAKGKIFTQKDAYRLSKYDRLVFLCGRYEGVDERVAKYLVHEEISVGKYVLTGGELPALIISDAVSRLKDGVLGDKKSLKVESWEKENTVEYPQYTRPDDFYNWKVPQVLLSGNHKEIEKWQKDNFYNLNND